MSRLQPCSFQNCTALDQFKLPTMIAIGIIAWFKAGLINEYSHIHIVTSQDRRRYCMTFVWNMYKSHTVCSLPTLWRHFMNIHVSIQPSMHQCYRYRDHREQELNNAGWYFDIVYDFLSSNVGPLVRWFVVWYCLWFS